ncbi:MAG: 50S ribosomal protein L18 [Candidatus Omnitrophota bacterium]|jgi:large subunit ribosomal protein L18
MLNKTAARIARHERIRGKISGDAERPRLVVYRSFKNFYAQMVDDLKHRTVMSLSTQEKSVKAKYPYGGNVKAAQFLGEVFAKKAIEQGIKKIVFDRAGYAYHGRVKAFGESLRKSGLEF